MNTTAAAHRNTLKTYSLLVTKAFKYIYPIDPNKYFRVKAALMHMSVTGALKQNCGDFSSAFLWSDTSQGNAFWKDVSHLCKEDCDEGVGFDERVQQDII